MSVYLQNNQLVFEEGHLNMLLIPSSYSSRCSNTSASLKFSLYYDFFEESRCIFHAEGIRTIWKLKIPISTTLRFCNTTVAEVPIAKKELKLYRVPLQISQLLNMYLRNILNTKELLVVLLPADTSYFDYSNVRN